MSKLARAQRTFAALMPAVLIASAVARGVVRNDLTVGNPTAFPGAVAFGMSAVWVNRAGNPGEYPDLAPVATVSDLNGVG